MHIPNPQEITTTANTDALPGTAGRQHEPPLPQGNANPAGNGSEEVAHPAQQFIG
jgi:hypothetical protein